MSGEDRLTLLLWALWNPIGFDVPPDEYARYSGPVASILARAHDVSTPIANRVEAGVEHAGDELQRLRDATHEELAAHLRGVREAMMNVEMALADERYAAQRLIDWYEWEMHSLMR